MARERAKIRLLLIVVASCIATAGAIWIISNGIRGTALFFFSEEAIEGYLIRKLEDSSEKEVRGFLREKGAPVIYRSEHGLATDSGVIGTKFFHARLGSYKWGFIKTSVGAGFAFEEGKLVGIDVEKSNDAP